MYSEVVLYHCNDIEKCENFIKNANGLIYSSHAKDDIWLGNGMYFWDNKANARWWQRKKENNNSNKEYCIVESRIKLDKLLDLTDLEVYNKMEAIWNCYTKTQNKNPDIPLGNKLNLLFTEMGFDKMYSTIKVYGKYNYTKNNGFFTYNVHSNKAEPTIAIKCIYNVKKSDCISAKGYLGDDNG